MRPTWPPGSGQPEEIRAQLTAEHSRRSPPPMTTTKPGETKPFITWVPDVPAVAAQPRLNLMQIQAIAASRQQKVRPLPSRASVTRTGQWSLPLDGLAWRWRGPLLAIAFVVSLAVAGTVLTAVASWRLATWMMPWRW